MALLNRETCPYVMAGGALALYVLDGPRTRIVLKNEVWAPATLLGCMLYRRHGGEDGAKLRSLLDIATCALRKTCSHIGACPLLREIAFDVAGLVLLREALKYALSLRRKGSLILTELLSPSRYPNSITSSPKKFFSVCQKSILSALMNVANRLPFMSSLIAKEVAKEVDKMEAEFTAKLRPDDRNPMFKMPDAGLTDSEIISFMKELGVKEDKSWENGKVSGAVYSGDAKHLDLLNKAYSAFCVSNPLHADLWPSSMKFESEVIRWVADLLRGGDEGVVGSLTSGGTESILLAAKAHRDRAIDLGLCTGTPEIIACVQAHAAIDKACDLMGIKLVKIPMDDEYKLDVAALRSAFTADTIMVYSSAPSFPQGTIDPIAEISALCLSRGVGLHVDCCLGGMFLPYMKPAGFGDHLPDFDFTLPGVTTISVDTHKYGYASKGTSVVLYRNKDYRKYQYFAYPEWPGGLYATPTVSGSRSGGLVAACWASLASIGRQGFISRTRDICITVKNIAQGVKEIPGLFLLEEKPSAMIVCFGSKEFNVLRVSDAMANRGWSLNALQNPNSVHLCCTLRTVGKENQFLSDLRACVDEVRASGSSANEEGNAAIYGMAEGMPNGPIKELMFTYTDVKYVV
jgi:glutamate/tyrosine decarboxylase-like PLP-dependent enzyme